MPTRGREWEDVMGYRVDEIARLVRGEVVGDGTIMIRGVTAIEEAREGSLVLAESPGYFSRAEASSASCVRGGWWARQSLRCERLVANPNSAFARVLGLY